MGMVRGKGGGEGRGGRVGDVGVWRGDTFLCRDLIAIENGRWGDKGKWRITVGEYVTRWIMGVWRGWLERGGPPGD